jgi:hypothetical protein
MVFSLARFRRFVFPLFAAFILVAAYFITQLRFSFDFEQFFPQGDPDLVFFQQFIQDFETDDNFLLVGVENVQQAGTPPDTVGRDVFDQDFLMRFDSLTRKSLDLPYVLDNQSLTTLKLPVKSAFGILPISAIHIDDTSAYAADRAKILEDPRFVRNLISEDATALVLFLKTKEKLSLEESEELMPALDSLVRSFGFAKYHYLGRANFQKELVWMEKREVLVSTIVAAVLVALIMLILFRRWKTVVLAMVSIGLSLVLFLGVLGAWGRTLSAMAALYPVLMVIIGTSDFIHMLSKYIDERRRGHGAEAAIWLTIKDIGLATLMTAVTTAIGFATLVTSRIVPIQEFGVNAAVGVMVAYGTVLLFTTALFSYFDVDDLILIRGSSTRVERLMDWVYRFTKRRSRHIGIATLLILGLCLWGISKIKTNYSIEDNMPLGQKVTEDFYFFEKVFAGFRPLEYAVFAENGRRADDFVVMQEIEKVENHLRQQAPIRSVSSPTMLYKSIHQMLNQNRAEAFVLPADSSQFADAQSFAEQIPKSAIHILLSKDGTKARIATRVADLGADSVMALGDKINAWIAAHTDPSVATFRRTGTGYIIDKNAMYVRTDLLEGIAWEVGLIALIMGLMLRNLRMIIIFLIPNLFPLLFAGALIGFLGVDLDAGISMVFTVVFGIAIDDTIHFLSSFNINRRKGLTTDAALRTTLLETGKPVCLTTVILFFGFLVMIFSIHPPSVIVGKLIAVTLITALLSDLFINPILIRWWIRD